MDARPEVPGDPAQLMSLLWRHQRPVSPSRRGPRPTRSVDDVVGAATRLADEHGLGSLSMRSVAAAVGVSTMALYTYVPSRGDLVTLMVDAVHADPAPPLLTALGWEERLRAVADANLALVRAHPWLTEVSAARPPLGPGVLSRYEHELAAFDGLGLDDVTIDDCLSAVLTFVHGTARAAAAAEAVRGTSGLSDAEWWAANGPVLAEVLDPGTFPRAVRVGTAAGAVNGSAYDAQRAYDFGLERLLAGIAALVAEART